MIEIKIQVSDAGSPLAIAQGVTDWVLHSFAHCGYGKNNDKEFIEAIGNALLVYAKYIKRSDENE